MKISWTQISLPIIISSVTLVAATSFHIGYFQRFKIEFISFISTGDLISFFAFSFPFALFIWLLMYFGSIDFILRFGAAKDSRLYRYVDWSLSYGVFGYIVLFAIPLAIVALGTAFLVGIDVFTDILLLLFFIFQLALWISIFNDQQYQTESITNTTAFFVMLSIALLSNKNGHICSEYLAGADCIITINDVDIDARFYRNVGSGVLVKFENLYTYTPHSQISKISCD